jgi:2-hydroxycyclohexanecarboxyl-CoA dehydrogenase
VSIKGMTIVVTGGASGIGRATALNLAQNGATVIIGDIDEKGGAAVASESKHGISYVPVDLREAKSVDAFVVSVLKTSPTIGGLVNAAGWDQVEPFMENTPELWDKLISINLLGTIRVTRGFLPTMIAANSGKIVNVSSDAGRVGSMGEVVYSACKGGIIAFTKALARETARYKINVNCVCPGPTDTPLLHSQTSPWALRIREGLAQAIPFRRLADPDEVAEGIKFFLSPQSGFVTGQILSVSGGLTMAG